MVASLYSCWLRLSGQRNSQADDRRARSGKHQKKEHFSGRGQEEVTKIVQCGEAGQSRIGRVR